MKRIKIFDTTLRDGEQSPGCSMNLTEKIEMARQLEKLGVDVIEAGFAIASPMDHKSVQAIAAAVTNCTVASLARCAKGDIDAAWDAVKEANHPRIHVFLATSDIHMEYKLKMTREQVIDRIREMLDGGCLPLRLGISGPLLLHCRRRGRDDAECARHRRLLHAAGDV